MKDWLLAAAMVLGTTVVVGGSGALVLIVIAHLIGSAFWALAGVILCLLGYLTWELKTEMGKSD